MQAYAIKFKHDYDHTLLEKDPSSVGSLDPIAKDIDLYLVFTLNQVPESTGTLVRPLNFTDSFHLT